jgi:hypothetical protein
MRANFFSQLIEDERKTKEAMHKSVSDAFRRTSLGGVEDEDVQ